MGRNESIAIQLYTIIIYLIKNEWNLCKLIWRDFFSEQNKMEKGMSDIILFVIVFMNNVPT